jgi:hypothetical protein
MKTQEKYRIIYLNWFVWLFIAFCFL